MSLCSTSMSDLRTASFYAKHAGWHRQPAFCWLRLLRCGALAVQVSVWDGAVLRGDLNSIRVSAFSNIGTRTVIHAARYT